MTADFSSAEGRLRLEKADLLVNVTVDGVSMQYLKGNVQFKKGEMVMNCNWARFNKKTEKGFLFENVSMVKNEQNLTCDSLFVDSPNNIMIAYLFYRTIRKLDFTFIDLNFTIIKRVRYFSGSNRTIQGSLFSNRN